MSRIGRLRSEHGELETFAKRLSKIIARKTPPPSAILYALRHEFSSALIRHLTSEDWDFYPRLLVSRDRQLADTARACSKEMGGLAKTFRDYAEQWGAYAIEGDWKRYQEETAQILRALTLRIEREEHDLYPLIEISDQAA